MPAPTRAALVARTEAAILAAAVGGATAADIAKSVIDTLGIADAAAALDQAIDRMRQVAAAQRGEAPLPAVKAAIAHAELALERLRGEDAAPPEAA